MRQRREVLDGFDELLRQDAGPRHLPRGRNRGTMLLHVAPLAGTVDEHATIAQDLEQHGGAAPTSLSATSCNGRWRWLEALTQPLQAKRIETPKRDDDIDVGVGLLLATREGAEDHGERDVGLGPRNRRSAPSSPQ